MIVGYVRASAFGVGIAQMIPKDGAVTRRCHWRLEYLYLNMTRSTTGLVAKPKNKIAAVQTRLMRLPLQIVHLCSLEKL